MTRFEPRLFVSIRSKLVLLILLAAGLPLLLHLLTAPLYTAHLEKILLEAADRRPPVLARSWREPLARLHMVSTGAMLFSACLALALSLVLVSRSITRPVRRLEEGLQLLVKGDLTHRFPVSGGNEFAELAGHLNRTAAHLERSFASISDTAHKLEMITRISTHFRHTVHREELTLLLLSGLTANYGLACNRAALFRVLDDGRTLQGEEAVGQLDREELEQTFGSYQAYKSLRISLQETVARLRHIPLEEKSLYVRGVRSLRLRLPRRVGHNLFARVLGEGRARVVRAAEWDSFKQGQQLKKRLNLQDTLLVPCFVEQQPYGLIILDRLFDGLPIDDNLINLVQVLVNQFSSSLENLAYFDKISAQRVLDHEMQLARDIQQGLIPRSYPQVPGVGIVTFYNPVDELGGDFFDFLPHEDGGFGLFISDATGHGIHAAFITSMEKMLLGSLAVNGITAPGEALAFLNRMLYRNIARNYLTAFLAFYHPVERRLVYANAGHVYPLLIRPAAEGKCHIQELRSTGKVIGMLQDTKYSEQTLHLEVGDRILFFTDGLTECRNHNNDFFEESRLHGFVRENWTRPADIFLASLIVELNMFCGRDKVGDDVTIVLLEIQTWEAGHDQA